MTLNQIASLIPAEYRTEIIGCRMIEHAQAHKADDNMNYLFTIWSTYIEHGLDMSCGLCIERILKNWKQLHPILIEMDKNAQLLKAI